MTEGHAQELKTQALAMKVGKRLRVMISDNNAGIDDSLIGGVIDAKFTGYNLVDQWTSYGWNVFTVANGNDYEQVVSALKALDDVDPADRRPLALIGKTVKGYWPAAVGGKIPDGGDQVVGYPSHPYAMKMNSEYFLSLAATFERRYGVQFQGIRDGVPKTAADRLVQFKTNIDVAMSVLDKNGIGDWLADRLVEIGDTLRDDLPLRAGRLARSVPRRSAAAWRTCRWSRRPSVPPTRSRGAKKDVKVTLFRKAGEIAGTRRGISEIVKWVNYVTDNRFLTIAADLSESINLEHGSIWGHYDPGDQSRRHAHQGRDPGGGQRRRARSASSARARRSTPRSSRASGPSAAPTARSRR